MTDQQTSPAGTDPAGEPTPPDQIPGQTAIDGLGQTSLVDEIEQTNDPETAAALTHEWLGLPMFQEDADPPKLVIHFESVEGMQRLMAALRVKPTKSNRNGRTLSARWPDTGLEDLISLRFATDAELHRQTEEDTAI